MTQRYQHVTLSISNALVRMGLFVRGLRVSALGVEARLWTCCPARLAWLYDILLADDQMCSIVVSINFLSSDSIVTSRGILEQRKPKGNI